MATTRARSTTSRRTHAAKPKTVPPNGGSSGGTKASPSGPGAATVHQESENHPWTIDIPDHPKRSDSPEYIASRDLMNKTAATVNSFYYAPAPYQDHHGGALWLKDQQGWFMVRNLAGMEWSSQFCADPARVDLLRQNAKRLYAAFPGVAKELGIEQLLDTPITDAKGVENWTDSICNASVPLPAPIHTGVLPQGGGVHHYPAPVVEIQLFKYKDFNLWVTDPQGQPAAVTPVAARGSGDARVQVVYATPNTDLHHQHVAAEQGGEQLILDAKHPMAKQAFKQQQAPAKT